MHHKDNEQRIVRRPDILLGKPVINGTRIPVYLIRDLVAAGLSADQIVEDYPDLTVEDVEAAMAYLESNPGNVESIVQPVP